MPTNDNDLRRLALQRHKAATRKVSRLKAGSGVEVSGSDYDPRKDTSFIRTASRKELQSYIRGLNKFNDRKTQFVPDADLKPMRRELWEQFKQVEAKKNKFVNEFYQPFKDVFIEPLGQTVDQRMAAITPLHAHMGQRTTDSPYKQANRSSTSVYGESGLKKLIEHTRKQATYKHEKQVLKNHKDGVLKMLQSIGDEQISSKLSKLSNKQWSLLWKYTPFASNIKIPYQHYKDAMDGKRSVTNSQMVATDLAVAEELIDGVLNANIRR